MKNNYWPVALLIACSLSAQTPRDTAHSAVQQPNIAVVMVHLQQYCVLTTAPNKSLCADTTVLRKLFLTEQALVVSSSTPAAPLPVATVTVTIDSSSLKAGYSAQAHAVAHDVNGAVVPGKTPAIWASLAPSTAAVTQAGVVTGINPGATSITSTIDGKSGAGNITVRSSSTPSPTPTDSLKEPVFDQSTETMVLDRNFNTYTTDSLRWTCGGPYPQPGRVVDHSMFYCDTFSPGYDGSVKVGPGHQGNGVQWHYDGVYQETHGVQVMPGTGATGKRATFVQYWARFVGDSSSGPYSLSQVDASGNSSAMVQIKNIMLFNDQNRFQWHFHGHGGGCPLYGPAYTIIGAIENVEQGCTSDQPVGPFFKAFTDGQWHRWTIQYKPNSTSGAHDGVARLWIDGTLTNNVERGACGITPPGGWKPWCELSEVDQLVGGTNGVSFLEWGANRTDQSGIPFTMSIDDVKWWVKKK